MEWNQEMVGIITNTGNPNNKGKVNVLIDIHCHILPGVDDGPSDLVACLEMANLAARSGITHLFATPHHFNGRFENPRVDILNYVVNINEHLQRENIPLTILPGQELRIHRELLQSLDKDEILTLDDKGKYLLVELPSGEVPSYTKETVYELLLKGITPIIVHPERNGSLIENNHLLFELVQEGALVQITSGSIIGQFGKRIKSFTKKIIEHQIAHFIATDAHNTNSRRFTLQEAYDTIAKTYGNDRTFYFKKNAELLIQGCKLYIEQPVPIRKKILGVF